MSMRTQISRDHPLSGRVVASAALFVVAGCSGLNDPFAGFDTVTYVSAVSAINGSPAGAATAINTATALTVRAGVTYEFDVAFDIDGTGRAVVLTQRAVGLPQNAVGHTVSLQPLTGAFESILEAPDGGWVSDSVLTVNVGQSFAVRASANVCQLFGSPFLYSKAVVDSVNITDRRLWLTVVTDPNCGFRSFAPGRPTF
jgi:hypothetical protein